MCALGLVGIPVCTENGYGMNFSYTAILLYNPNNVWIVSGKVFQRRRDSLLITNNTACVQERFKPRMASK